MKASELTEKELKLLILILEDCESHRQSMGCNEPYKEEEKLFSKKERIEMGKSLMVNYAVMEYDEDEEDDGFLFNNQYVQYIIDRIKEQ